MATAAGLARNPLVIVRFRSEVTVGWCRRHRTVFGERVGFKGVGHKRGFKSPGFNCLGYNARNVATGSTLAACRAGSTLAKVVTRAATTGVATMSHQG